MNVGRSAGESVADVSDSRWRKPRFETAKTAASASGYQEDLSTVAPIGFADPVPVNKITIAEICCIPRGSYGLAWISF